MSLRDRVREARQRAEAALGGLPPHRYERIGSFLFDLDDDGLNRWSGQLCPNNGKASSSDVCKVADLLAHAPEDVPLLAAALERVLSDDLRDAIEAWWRENVPNVGDVPYSNEGACALMALIERTAEGSP
jgi:hypothetical protein